MIDLQELHEWRYRDPETGLLFPWYTKPCLDEIINWPLEDMNVLEIGGGSSTVWWNKKAKSVFTIESNEDYYKAIVPYLKKESNAFFGNPLYYLAKIKEAGYLFDLVIIDGIEREKCVIPSFELLYDDGIVIYDNWMQEEVEIQSEETQKILTSMRHSIYKEEMHPNWKTLVVYKQ